MRLLATLKSLFRTRRPVEPTSADEKADVWRRVQRVNQRAIDLKWSVIERERGERNARER